MAVDRDIGVVAALVIGLPAFALANGALLASLLSNGIGLAMLLIYLSSPVRHESLWRSSALVHAVDVGSRI
jgi:hypothetical protein